MTFLKFSEVLPITSRGQNGARSNFWWAQEAICGAPWRPPRIEDENPYVPILVRTRVAHHPRFQIGMQMTCQRLKKTLIHSKYRLEHFCFSLSKAFCF